jgi:Ser-tRNA(Ala) deacylase AlaX
VYPESDLSLIHTPVSVEPCCGTHVFNTGDIQVRFGSLESSDIANIKTQA